MVGTSPLVRQRDIWIAELPEPVGSEAGYRRPVIIVQADPLNVSRMTTFLVVPVTGLSFRTAVPWNLSIAARRSRLGRDSVAQTNLMLTVNERQLIEHVGQVSETQLAQLFMRLDIVLGRA